MPVQHAIIIRILTKVVYVSYLVERLRNQYMFFKDSAPQCGDEPHHNGIIATWAIMVTMLDTVAAPGIHEKHKNPSDQLWRRACVFLLPRNGIPQFPSLSCPVSLLPPSGLPGVSLLASEPSSDSVFLSPELGSSRA